MDFTHEIIQIKKQKGDGGLEFKSKTIEKKGMDLNHEFFMSNKYRDYSKYWQNSNKPSPLKDYMMTTMFSPKSS